MPYVTNPHTTSRNSGYVEYKDVFARPDIVPSAGMHNFLLLFDTFDGTNPLNFLHSPQDNKMYQKTCLFVISGSCSLAINGKEVTVEAGSLITIMPENTTVLKTITADTRYFMFVIYPKLANLNYNDLGITYSNAKLSLRHFVSRTTPEQMDAAMLIYKELKHDLLGGTYPYQDIYIRSITSALLVENLNIHHYDLTSLLGGNSNSRQYDMYCRFLAALNKHSNEHRTVQFYANLLGISSKYLSFVCISYSRKNASKWIEESVAQRAKALMVVHHYTIMETSDILNFTSIRSFTQFFKRVEGMTPKEYVNRHGASALN